MHLTVQAASNPGYRLCRSANPGCTAGGTIVAINSGTEVNEWCTCKTITNTGSTDFFVPTNTEAEYRAFLTNLPTGVSLGACTTNAGVGTYKVTIGATGFSLRGCDRINGTITGGGGGGGIRDGASANAGPGGVGGKITFTAATFTPSSPGLVDIVVATGGSAGSCQSAATGGTGGYAGGVGSQRSTTNGTAQEGQVGLGTTANGGSAGTDTGGSDHGAGAGKYGGGGGGGDRATQTRNGGGGGGASTIIMDSVDFIIAGGAGGGGGTRANGAAAIGGTGGNACPSSANGQVGGGDNSSNACGPGGGGGACLASGVGGGIAYAATGGAAGTMQGACSVGNGTGGAGTIDITFSRSTALP